MTLRQRLARQRRKRDAAARDYNSTTARIKSLVTRMARRPRLGVFIAEKFNLRVTSTWRSVQHNKDVGGVPNSWHTKGSLLKPGATDWVGTEANMAAAQAWVRANVPNIAESLIHDVGSGRHLHVGGWGVANFRWPERAELEKLRAERKRNKADRSAARKAIDALKAKLADRPVKAKGIDISDHQGVVDFAKVKAAGHRFVWIKAGEGVSGGAVDPFAQKFIRNVKAARAAGLKVGAYHFVHPRADRSGAAEAEAFHRRLKAAGLGKGDLIPVLDIEVSNGRSAAQIGQYSKQAYDRLRELTGGPVAIYTFSFFLPAWPEWAKSAPLWIADFRGLDKPTVPKPWTSFVAWQHTAKGSVPGITGDVDKNVTADLRKLIA